MYSLHLCIMSIVSLSESSKILVVFPFPVKSHGSLGNGFVSTLLEAGHEVTYVTPYPDKFKQSTANLTQIDVSDNIKLAPEKSLKDGMPRRNSLNAVYGVLTRTLALAHNTVANENVQRLLKDLSQQFDLVIAEWMFCELYVGLSAVYQCPLIWVSSAEPHWMLLRLAQLTWNPEFHRNLDTKNVHLPFSFPQRVQEFVDQMRTSALKIFVFHGIATEHYENLFAPIISKKRPAVPTFKELAMNASLIMVNSHVALAPTMPLPPNCVSIGGYHIDTNVEALPRDLQQIMDEATHGVIYFSMGSFVSGCWPQDMIRDLLDLFGSLNQTVLWKLDQVPFRIPNNVYILPWTPQQSILKHPNCSIFITHGGLLSMTEALHFGVQIIGIPVFADQFANVANAEKKGFGKSVELSSSLVGDLKAAIEEVTGNSKYEEKAKQLSHMYHDQTSPRKRLVAWVEYVARTHGAPHLRSPALLVPWYQQWFLDIIFPSLTIVLLISWFLRHI